MSALLIPFNPSTQSMSVFIIIIIIIIIIIGYFLLLLEILQLLLLENVAHCLRLK